MEYAPKRFRWALALVASLFAVSLAPEQRTPAVRYELTFAPRDGEAAPFERRPSWQLRVAGEHFDADDGAICLVFNSWGNWREIDSLYLDVVSAEPPVDAELLPGNALVLQLPEEWKGEFAVEFEITPIRAGTKANERWGMLPRWSPTYSFGQTRNVFPKVYQDAGEVDVDAVLSIGGTYGMQVATGWDGVASGTRQVEVEPTHGNGFLAFGTPSATASRALTHGEVQVLQYGRSRAIAEPVADLVGPLAESMASALSPHRDPLVVFISDVGAGGMGADHGLVLGYEPSAPDWLVESPYYQHFVAHELFHHWLGSQLDGSESFTWFHEGFTEYFALWHLAAVQRIDQAWFHERIAELGREAIDHSSWGSIAFADKGVNWRDGDGPNETMAYKGGAVLAFALDIELREDGRSGALQMLRDFLDEGKSYVTLEELEQWCRDNGCADFWNRFVAGKEVPDLDALLERARALPNFFRFDARN